VDHVTAVLRAAGWDGTVHAFPDGVRTAQAAADGLGCEVGAIANSLIFDAAGSPVLILTSGAHRVDTAKVAVDLGLPSLDRASAEFVRLHTGQAIGGVAPVGHPTRIPTYLDRALAAYDPIWAAAGHSHAVFDTTYPELRDMTTGRRRGRRRTVGRRSGPCSSARGYASAAYRLTRTPSGSPSRA
jgi:prolyl-tRNA editing enzyme YbaK/EbsC (Cys-tRNA(Pro) deacylase)